MVKKSIDICEKKGVLGAGYIPKLHWTQATANSEGLFAYFRYADASFILTCRTPDGTGSGWAGTTGVKDVSQIDAGGAHRSRGRQGAQVAEAARDRARQLHRDPRTASGRALPVADAAAPSTRAPAEEGRSFMSGKERGQTRLGEKLFGDNVTLRSVIGRSDPAADADRPGRPGRARRHLGREGRRQEPVLRPLLGAEDGQDADAHVAGP